MKRSASRGTQAAARGVRVWVAARNRFRGLAASRAGNAGACGGRGARIPRRCELCRIRLPQIFFCQIKCGSLSGLGFRPQALPARPWSDFGQGGRPPAPPARQPGRGRAAPVRKVALISQRLHLSVRCGQRSSREGKPPLTRYPGLATGGVSMPVADNGGKKPSRGDAENGAEAVASTGASGPWPRLATTFAPEP